LAALGKVGFILIHIKAGVRIAVALTREISGDRKQIGSKIAAPITGKG
jgi:hypothetical protein